MTLTQTAKMFRAALASVFAAFIALLFLRMGLDTYHLFFPQKNKPTGPEPTPSALFGKLPPLEITPLRVNLQGAYTLKLDLVEAKLPTEPTQAAVAPFLHSPYGFLSDERTKELVKRFNLSNSTKQRLSAIESIWSTPNETLRVNEQSLNLTYRYDFRADPKVLVRGALTTQEQARNLAVEQLKRLQLLGSSSNFSHARGQDLIKGHKNVFLLELRNDQLSPASSISQALLYRVDFYREPFNNYPILPPDFNQALVNALVTGNQDHPLIELNYTYWSINRNQVATYPIIQSQEAWRKLQQQLARYLVFLGDLRKGPLTSPPTSPQIQTFKARQVYLGYYDPPQPQSYLQPIWVFEGKAVLVDGSELDWAAYVPAIANEWIRKSP